MHLRWSNGYSHAVELQCNEQSLAPELFQALVRFRANTGYLPSQLHVEINGKWWNPGRVKSTNGVTYFEPAPIVVFPIDTGPELENLNIWLVMMRNEIIRMVVDTHSWLGALSNMILDVDDTIKREVGYE